MAHKTLLYLESTFPVEGMIEVFQALCYYPFSLSLVYAGREVVVV
jgi:hypothetical protein